MTKPSDFMLGILDFFAVLLPGAIATWLLSHYLPLEMEEALRLKGDEHASVLPWIVYLLTSYGLGHFVFMAGSKLDTLYDRWRKRTKPTESDVPFRAAKDLRERLTPALTGDGFSTFKWARSYVGIHSAPARLEIDRLEASSKFFRGMVVVSAAAVAHFLIARHDAALAGGAVVICALSFWRFCDQRWKMTELTYATAVILHATAAKVTAGGGETEDEDDE